MKFYIATTTSRWRDHNLVRDVLVAGGHEITYDWTQHGENGSLQGLPSEERSKYARLECEAIEAADYVVGLLPGGFGTNSEIGMTAVLRKPTYLHATDPALFGRDTCPNNFYFHPHAARNATLGIEEFAESVLADLLGPESPVRRRG